MNNLNPITMSSREIAELTGKPHGYIVLDIRDMAEQLLTDTSLERICKLTTYIDAKGESRAQYEMNKNVVFMLMSGYDVVARSKIIKRWQELESQQIPVSAPISLPQTEAALAAADLHTFLTVADIFDCPLHLAQIRAVKLVHEKYGIDFSPLLVLSPAQNDVGSKEAMLSPVDLGQNLGGFTPRYINTLLSDLGLQTKVNGVWEATPLGKAFCSRHTWKAKDKSGHCLRWNFAKIKALINL